jgi:hypothetical protein
LELKPSADGVSFAVKVTPRASKDSLNGFQEGVLKIRLNAPPVDGAANKALVRFLAKTLNTSKSRVKVISGEKSRQKRIKVSGLAPDQVKKALGA